MESIVRDVFHFKYLNYFLQKSIKDVSLQTINYIKMEYGIFDLLTLLGSLALFLYGMKIMSDGLQKLAGNKLRGILASMTKNRAMGVLTGIVITALIQSSSATTVMVVSFVNAGLISLVQSIGVIMGANLGTTLTAWIIAFFGFGKFSIGALSIPLMGIAIPLIFSSKSKNKSIGEFVFGFAFLFMGLDYLKDSMPDLQNNPEVLSFVQNFAGNGFSSILFFLFIGAILTVVVQSSSATVALTIIMASKGWIDFPSAAAMVLGENIGTTITSNLAAIPANISAKRAAFSHLLFNVLGVIWMLFVFKYFVMMVEGIVASISSVHLADMPQFINSLSPEAYQAITNPNVEVSADYSLLHKQYLSYQAATSYGLALFHTLFNIANLSIMIWFVKFYEKLCLIVIRPKKGEVVDEEFVLKYIGSGMSVSAELSILQAEKEIELYAMRAHRMFGFVRQMTNMENNNKEFIKLYERTEKYEDICDRMEIEIGNYLGKVTEGRLSNESKEHVRNILRVVTEIESIADSSSNIARHLKRKAELDIKFNEMMLDNINEMFDLTELAFERMQERIKARSASPRELIISQNIEKQINERRNQYKNQNIENVNQSLYSYQEGVLYMDIITECEKMGDYIINVVEAINADSSFN